MLQTKSISFSYQSAAAFSIKDLHLKGGDELLLLGKSGSGKTTILNILAGLLPPDQGEVILDGVSIYQLSGTRLDQFRGKNIGIVFQKPHLLQPLSVEENIRLANFFVANPKSHKAAHLLEELGISDKRNAKVAT